MIRITLVFAATLATAFAWGCGGLFDPCRQIACDCASPLIIHVAAPDGGTLTDVSAEGTVDTGEGPSAATGDCFAGGPGAWDCHLGPGPGQYEVELSAPGYQAAQVSREVKPVKDTGSCCECGYATEQVTVSLMPE